MQNAAFRNESQTYRSGSYFNFFVYRFDPSLQGHISIVFSTKNLNTISLFTLTQGL